MPPGGTAFPLTQLGAGKYATVVSGTSRATLNRVLFAMTRAVDPSPFWVEFRAESGAEAEPGPADLGWIPSDRLVYAMDSENARPQNVGANLAMVVVSAGSDTWSRALTDMLRLPPVLQEIVGRVRGGEPAHAVAIANGDRVARHYPPTPAEMRGVIEGLLAAPLLPFFSTANPQERRFAADFVFRLEAASLPHWRDGLLLVEQAPKESGLSADDRFPLGGFPELERVFGPNAPG
jgi:hypothetical protein